MDAALMQPQRHERGIHAVWTRRGVGGVGMECKGGRGSAGGVAQGRLLAGFREAAGAMAACVLPGCNRGRGSMGGVASGRARREWAGTPEVGGHAGERRSV